MSGHGHHDAHDDALDHDDHEHETSSDDFPADEPRSPGWLPLLGGALLLAGIFTLVAVNAGDGKTTEELAKDAAAAAPSGSVAAVPAPSPSPAQRPAPPIPVGAQLPTNHPQLLPGGGTH